MSIELQALIDSYTATFADTLMDVLTVVVPAGVALLVIRLSISWARSYFRKFAK